MNLTFDLQVFVDPKIKTGVSYSSGTYTLGDVELTGNFDSSNSVVARFNYDSTDTKFYLGTGKFADSYDGSEPADVVFEGDSGDAAVQKTTLVSSKYTWELDSTAITDIDMREKTKLVLNSAPAAGVKLTVGEDGGQTVTFANKKSIELAMQDSTATIGDVAFLGGMGNVSLLSGSSVKGVSVTGAADEVVTLADNGTDAATLNLKGSGSEAFVTVKGTVHSSSVVSGFNSLIFDANKVTSNSTEVSLDGGVRDSNVSILGGEDVDTVVIGANTRSSDILINGGKGADVISLSGTGYETLVLGKDHGADTVTNWAEAVGGDTSKGNTISIAGAIDTFLVSAVEDGYANVSVGSAGATFTGDGATIHSSESDENTQLGINITTEDDTYSALLVGSDALDEKLGTRFDRFDYIIADSGQTLDLGKTKKKTVVLANELDEKHWGDTNVYQNVVTVKASSEGGSMIVNGKEEAAYLEANGKNDSIWGGANSVGDTIALGDATNAKIFTGVNDGADSLISYAYGSKAANANAVYFLDGVGHIAADENSLTIGANEENNMVVQVDSASSTGDKVAYGFGTDSDKYVAMVDMTKKGDAGIAYDSDVNVYIGQGDTYIDIASGTKDVKLGWDGGAGYVSIGGVNAASAADGAVVVGTTDNAQIITGSSKGASSISGGFVADKWTDENDDTLVGGGIASKSTTFFVGKEMGKDEINDLSSKDNIVFLGTKYADLAKALTPDTSDSYITFEFSNGNKIEANLVGSKKMKDLSDVSLYFDDGTYIWNGSTLEKAE